jgi:hypothetical protein
MDLAFFILNQITTEISNTNTLGSLCSLHPFPANCQHKIFKRTPVLRKVHEQGVHISLSDKQQKAKIVQMNPQMARGTSRQQGQGRDRPEVHQLGGTHKLRLRSTVQILSPPDGEGKQLMLVKVDSKRSPWNKSKSSSCGEPIPFLSIQGQLAVNG